jgi:hypothetical protein
MSEPAEIFAAEEFDGPKRNSLLDALCFGTPRTHLI